MIRIGFISTLLPSTAFYWSMCQLTPGWMDAGAFISLERSFNIVILLSGLLFCAALIPRLSTLMVQLSISKTEARKVPSEICLATTPWALLQHSGP